MKTVLFICICVHNSGRSQMAEAFFNHMAKGKARAISAGSQPADDVNPPVVEAMYQVGIDISKNTPRKLTLEILDQADKVITMGCGVAQSCPAMFTETEDWNLEDPKGKSIEEVRAIRDQIKALVEKLIENLA